MTDFPAPTSLPQRLLGVWAHPDDEAYLSAGLMARMTDAGRSVTVVHATLGERGTDDPAKFDSAAFAAERHAELQSSLATAGVHDSRLLGYRDGECDLVADNAAINAIATVMRDVRPDMVITFGPDGITGHPDHRAASRWTTEAWRRVGTGSLHYATMTHDFVAEHQALHNAMGVFDDFGLAGPSTFSRQELSAEFDLSERELDRKRRALAAHGSQTDGLADFMGEEVYRRWWRGEWFRTPTAAEMAACPLPVRTPLAEPVAAR